MNLTTAWRAVHRARARQQHNGSDGSRSSSSGSLLLAWIERLRVMSTQSHTHHPYHAQRVRYTHSQRRTDDAHERRTCARPSGCHCKGSCSEQARAHKKTRCLVCGKGFVCLRMCMGFFLYAIGAHTFGVARRVQREEEHTRKTTVYTYA